MGEGAGKAVDYIFTLFNHREKGNSESRIFDEPETFHSVANHTTLPLVGICLVHLPALNLKILWINEYYKLRCMGPMDLMMFQDFLTDDKREQRTFIHFVTSSIPKSRFFRCQGKLYQMELNRQRRLYSRLSQNYVIESRLWQQGRETELSFAETKGRIFKC